MTDEFFAKVEALLKTQFETAIDPGNSIYKFQKRISEYLSQFCRHERRMQGGHADQSYCLDCGKDLSQG